METKVTEIKLDDLKNLKQLYIAIKNIELGCRARRLLPLHSQAVEDFVNAIGRSKWVRNHPGDHNLTGISPGEIKTRALLTGYPYNDSRPGAAFTTQLAYHHEENTLVIMRQPCLVSYRENAYDAFGYVKLSVPKGLSPLTLELWKYDYQDTLWQELQTFCQRLGVWFGADTVKRLKRTHRHLPMPSTDQSKIHLGNGGIDLVWEIKKKARLTVNCKQQPGSPKLTEVTGCYFDLKKPGNNITLGNYDAVERYAEEFTRGPF